MKLGLIASILLLPGVVIAQGRGLQQIIPEVGMFIYQVLVPFLIGVAFLVVVVNIVRYFVVGSTNQEGRDKAKAYLLYSIIAFVLIFTFIGIVLLLANATSLGGGYVAPPSDYEQQFGTPTVPGTGIPIPGTGP